MKPLTRARLTYGLGAALAAAALLLAIGCQAPAAPAPTATKAPAAPTKAPAAEPTKAPAAPAATKAPAAEPTKAPAAPAAANFPVKPIEAVVHTNPGDGAHTFIQMLASILSKDIGVKQPVNVVPKVGGSGATMFGYMQTKAGDPHHFMPYQASTITTPIKAGLDVSYRDFTPISLFAGDPLVVTVRADSPFKTLKDLVEEGRKAPKHVKFGGSMMGSSDTIVGWLLGEAAGGVQFNFIAFAGGGEALVALLGGNTDFMCSNPQEVLGQIEAGKVRALAVSSSARLPALKDVPTIKEAGYDVEYEAFRGWAAAPKIPADAHAVYRDWGRKIFESATFKKYMNDNLMVPKFMDSADTLKFMDEKQKMFERVMNAMGIVEKKK